MFPTKISQLFVRFLPVFAVVLVGLTLVSSPSTSALSTTNMPHTFAAPGGTSIDDADACDANLSNPLTLTWLVCPLVDLAAQALQGFDEIITDLLYFDTAKVFSVNNNDPAIKKTAKMYNTAWNSFRYLALGIVLLAALVMAISHSLGFELFDAYTIRKILPRLLFAVVAINLSWAGLEYIIDFFNTLGIAIRNLIYAPFSGLRDELSMSGSILGILITGLLAKTATLSLGLPGIWSIFVVGGAAMLIGITVLILRDLSLQVIIILAPIAFAAYILPNTQRLWKLWSTTLISLLIMFPIISAMVAAGKVFSAIASQGNGMYQVIGIVAYFAPYFLLAFAFRLAGGAMAQIGNLMNDKSRGFFDRQRNKRAEIAKDRRERADSGHLWNPESRVQQALHGNRLAGAMQDPLGSLGYAASEAGMNVPYFTQKGHKVKSAINAARLAQTQKLAEELNTRHGYNDRAFRVLSSAHTGLMKRDENGNLVDTNVTRELRKEGLFGRAPRTLAEFNKVADILDKHGDGDADYKAANALRSSAGRLSTLYQDHEMGKANLTGAGIMGLASHGFANGADLAETGNNLLDESGPERLRADEAHGLMIQAQLMGTRGRPDVKAGYGIVFDPAAKKYVNGMDSSLGEKSRAQPLLASLSPQDVAGAKGGFMDDMRPHIEERLSNPDENIKTAQREQLFSWASPYSSASQDVKVKALEIINSHPETSAEFQKFLAGRTDPKKLGIDSGGGPPDQGAGGPEQAK